VTAANKQRTPTRGRNSGLQPENDRRELHRVWGLVLKKQECCTRRADPRRNFKGSKWAARPTASIISVLHLYNIPDAFRIIGQVRDGTRFLEQFHSPCNKESDEIIVMGDRHWGIGGCGVFAADKR